MLTATDRELLLRSAARSRGAADRAAWAEWAAAAARSGLLPGDLRDLPAEIHGELGR